MYGSLPQFDIKVVVCGASVGSSAFRTSGNKAPLTAVFCKKPTVEYKDLSCRKNGYFFFLSIPAICSHGSNAVVGRRPIRYAVCSPNSSLVLLLSVGPAFHPSFPLQSLPLKEASPLKYGPLDKYHLHEVGLTPRLHSGRHSCSVSLAEPGAMSLITRPWPRCNW